MDPSAVNHNITIDDFDSILDYSDQSQWTTDDPSASGFDAAGSPWLRGTFHNTTAKGAQVGLNFTGPGIYVYGSNGPAYGSYQVVIDSQVTLNGSNYRQAGNGGSNLIFAASDMNYANHNIVFTNLGRTEASGDMGGDAFVIDYILSTVQLAPSGATVQNITYEETDPGITYSGTWGSNTGPVFSGGGTTFTHEDGASFEFKFEGSALYVLGDKKNDHRAYTVTLDDQPAVTYNGTSGCGGVYGQTCEQQVPCIKFVATNLAAGGHTVKVVNNANGPAQGGATSFFDLDSIVVTVPSQYGPRQLTTGASSPFVSQTPSVSGATSISASASPTGGVGGGGASTSAAPSSLLVMWNPLILLVFGVLLVLRPWSGMAVSTRSRT